MQKYGNAKKQTKVGSSFKKNTREYWEKPVAKDDRSFVPGMTEEYYYTQVSEEIEGRVTRNVSQEFNRTESRILGALSKVDEFLLNPQVRTFSRTVPGTTRNNDLENRDPTEDRSRNDPYPEVEFSARWTSISVDADQEETSHTI